MLSLLFNLLLASICFVLLFCVIFDNFFYNSCKYWKCKTKTCTCYSAAAPTAVPNDAIDMLPLIGDKTIKYFSKHSKEAIYLLSFLLINSLWQISAIKYCLISLILFNLNCYWSFEYIFVASLVFKIAFKLLPLSIKSINPIQKYPLITEWNTENICGNSRFIDKFFDFFWNMFYTKTVKTSSNII